MNNNNPPNLWAGQFLHFTALVVLLALTWFFWVRIGSPFPILFWLTIAIPVVHQVFTWACWRMELNSKAVSNSIGFKSYLTLFFLFLFGRPVVIFILAWVDRESLGLNTISRIFLSIVLLVPAFLTMYSVKRYFGFTRAAGGDHFDSRYQNMPLVKKGIFKYSSNSMYVFGFLMFWGIAIIFDSKAALLASAFCHLYIWLHYFTTEKPDMNYLYRNHQQVKSLRD